MWRVKSLQWAGTREKMDLQKNIFNDWHTESRAYPIGRDFWKISIYIYYSNIIMQFESIMEPLWKCTKSHIHSFTY